MSRSIPDDIRQRLDKLRNLAERGVGGEASAARAQYEKVLAKLGISAEEYEQRTYAPTDVEGRTYTFTSKYAKNLLLHIYGYVTGIGRVRYRDQRSGKGVILRATPYQHDRIRDLYRLHKPLLEKHLERAMLAYINANRLVAPVGSADGASSLPYSAEDLQAIRAMMQGVGALPDPTLGRLTNGERN